MIVTPFLNKWRSLPFESMATCCDYELMIQNYLQDSSNILLRLKISIQRLKMIGIIRPSLIGVLPSSTYKGFISILVYDFIFIFHILGGQRNQDLNSNQLIHALNPGDSVSHKKMRLKQNSNPHLLESNYHKVYIAPVATRLFEQLTPHGEKQ